ncbi:tumor protein p53-inducible nuclear protein 2 [Salminus brasiliensis]|uniref:tumor protein p53-inducible nuclear protein 2 n=1 Tax=Salminus brasiliensis TaxID=930266 RepID=UPI003B83167A
MIGKIFAQLLGSAEEGAGVSVENEGSEEVFEFEDGEWVIINLHENRSLGRVEEDPLENLLIEHPSMSVYQMRRGRMEEQEEEASDEDEEDSLRPAPVRRHVSWRLAAWGSPLPILLSVQRAKAHVDRRKLTRSALNRQNLANTRFSPADRRYGQFKQPTQRLYNY